MRIARRNFVLAAGATVAYAALGGRSLAHSGAVNANSEGLRAGSDRDQGKVLQAILDKAAAQRKPVVIEPGRYKISGINLPEFVHLEGLGGATKLEFSGDGHFITGKGCQSITLQELEIDGGLIPLNSETEAMVYLVDAEQLRIEDCILHNSAGSGMELYQCGGKVRGNRVDACIGTAGLFCEDSTGLEITDNLIENCGNCGIMIYRQRKGEDNTLVMGNRVRHISALYGGTGPWGNGINTYLSNNARISNNHVSDCAFSAIRSNSCDNIAIDGNTCLRSGETGIYSEFEFQGATITDNVVDGASTGISVANFDKGGRLSICSGNLVRNLHREIPYEDPQFGDQGIGIYVEADTVVTANVIENAPQFGIELGWGPYLRNVVASSNVVSKSMTGIAISLVEGIGSVRVDNNLFSDIRSYAIAGYRWHDRVTDELAITQRSPVPQLSLSGNRVDA